MSGRDLGWEIDPPLGDDAEIGATYICRARYKNGRTWGKFVITITNKEPIYDESGLLDMVYSFTLDTILDGSPGLVDGWV